MKIVSWKDLNEQERVDILTRPATADDGSKAKLVATSSATFVTAVTKPYWNTPASLIVWNLIILNLQLMK